MKVYDPDDVLTCYFVILDDGKNRQIRGWTDSKPLAQAYMEFHSCKGMTMKSKTSRFRDMVEILNENTNDEIGIHNINIRDPEKKKKHQRNVKLIAIPATQAEMMFIRDEGSNFMYTKINYSYLSSAIPYLKGKYQRALDHIFLSDVIRRVLHNQSSKIVESMEIDQLCLYLRSFPEQFG